MKSLAPTIRGSQRSSAGPRGNWRRSSTRSTGMGVARYGESVLMSAIVARSLSSRRLSEFSYFGAESSFVDLVGVLILAERPC